MVAVEDKAASRETDDLAILVSTDKHLDYLVNLTSAAFEKDKRVCLFFTGRGVLLTVQPEFKKLVGKAALRICDFSFRANGLDGREHEVPGVTKANFATQAENAEILAGAHRHLVF
ncbi:MAG: hypothetical protein PVG51_01115 [Desulfosarcina sp.]